MTRHGRRNRRIFAKLAFGADVARDVDQVAACLVGSSVGFTVDEIAYLRGLSRKAVRTRLADLEKMGRVELKDGFWRETRD